MYVGFRVLEYDLGVDGRCQEFEPTIRKHLVGERPRLISDNLSEFTVSPKIKVRIFVPRLFSLMIPTRSHVDEPIF